MSIKSNNNLMPEDFKKNQNLGIQLTGVTAGALAKLAGGASKFAGVATGAFAVYLDLGGDLSGMPEVLEYLALHDVSTNPADHMRDALALIGIGHIVADKIGERLLERFGDRSPRSGKNDPGPGL